MANSLSAQTVSNVNFDEIKVSVSDSASMYYYPNLESRLRLLDTTLSIQEFRYLYYGNVFQEYYHPYGSTEAKRLFLENYSRKSFEEVEELGLKVLEENPVDLEVILKMLFLYAQHENIEKATVFSKIYVSFLEVIYGSGDGMACETAFVVISVDDEYRIAGDLGLNPIKQELIGSCDFLQFSKKGQKRKNRIKALFFNVRMPLTYLSKSFDQSDLPEPDDDPDEEE